MISMKCNNDYFECMKIISLFVFFCLFANCTREPLLTIEAPKYAGTTCVLSFSNRVDSIMLDQQGKASVAITPLMNFGYLNVKNKARVKFYTGLESLNIRVDSNNQILFEGKHAEASRYLTNVKYPQVDYFQIEACKTKEEYQNYLQEYSDTLNQMLSAANLDDAEFIRLQQLDFKYTVDMFRMIYLLQKRQLGAEEIKYFQSVFTENEQLLQLSAYCYAMYRFPQDLVKYRNRGKNLLPYEEMREVLAYYQEHYQNPWVKEMSIHLLTKEYLSVHGNDPVMNQVYRAHVNGSLLLKEYDVLSRKWQNLCTGALCPPPATATNLDGDPLDFKQYKGKYIFIDIWATWCAPCKREQRIMFDKEPEFVGKNIVFITLSCDVEREKWIKYCLKNGMKKKHHYNIQDKARLCDLYAIRTIPRFILIDPEGKLVSANFSYPSSNEFNAILNRLLEK